jgi:hypothetical protein
MKQKRWFPLSANNGSRKLYRTIGVIHWIDPGRYQVTEMCLLAKKILLPKIGPRSRKDTGFGIHLESYCTDHVSLMRTNSSARSQTR